MRLQAELTAFVTDAVESPDGNRLFLASAKLKRRRTMSKQNNTQIVPALTFVAGQT